MNGNWVSMSTTQECRLKMRVTKENREQSNKTIGVVTCLGERLEGIRNCREKLNVATKKVVKDSQVVEEKRRNSRGG